jgi:PAS domain S-box-containing protein
MDTQKKELLNVIDKNFAELLLESMAEGVFTIDGSGKIESWNPSMERITGFSKDEVIGKTCEMMGFDKCYGKMCPKGIKECGIYEKGNIDGKECFLIHKKGHEVPVVKSARLIKEKDGNIIGVVETVTDMSELYKVRLEAEEANRKLGQLHRFDKLIGKSTSIQKVFISIKATAASESTILIQGESGTGKELVARAIHDNGSRSEMPFITINCSALSESLLESELFGHAKGSFTGASRDRIGRFEEAERGTLFLDEIGEISPFIQIKLLRVLQERVIERVGESKNRKIDIRVITATNKDLFTLVNDGTFRQDLYYRLKVFPINIPPLRERKDDIALLTSHFINIYNKKTGKKISGVTQPAMRILLDYNWPGNVRELENAIEHAFILCINEHIDIFDLPVEIRKMEYNPSESKSLEIDKKKIKTKRQKLNRELLIEVLKESDWNKAEVGRRVGLSRASIWKYMKKWNIPLKQGN